MIWENYYKDSIDFFGMLQEDRAIVLNVNEGKIDLINLNNHTISSVNHLYQMEDTSYMKIVVFSETNIFAVIEKNMIKEELRFIITYYRRED
jgi:thiamine pyrophosphokinase